MNGLESTKREYAYVVVVVWLSLAIVGCSGLGGGVRLQPLGSKIEYDGANGNAAFELEPGTGKVKLQSADSKEIARYRYKGEKISCEAAAGARYRFLPAGKGVDVFQGSAEAPVYRFREEPDGDYQLLGPGDDVFYEIKLRDYGFKVVDRSGSETKVRKKPNKISLSGVTEISTRHATTPLAAACFALGELPMEVRAGLSVSVMYWRL